MDETAELRAIDVRTGGGVDLAVLLVGVVVGGLAVGGLPRLLQAKAKVAN